MSNSITENSISRNWAAVVSLGLWAFAAWQLFMLPAQISCFMSLGIPTPDFVRDAASMSPWTPLLVGIPLTFSAALLSVRWLRIGVALLALLSASCAHWTHVLMQMQMVVAVHRSRPIPPKPTALPVGTTTAGSPSNAATSPFSEVPNSRK